MRERNNPLPFPELDRVVENWSIRLEFEGFYRKQLGRALYCGSQWTQIYTPELTKSTWSYEKSVYAELEQCTFRGVATEIWNSYFGLFWSDDIALSRFRVFLRFQLNYLKIIVKVHCTALFPLSDRKRYSRRLYTPYLQSSWWVHLGCQ